MHPPVPELLKAPYPICYLKMWIEQMLRHTCVQEKLEQAACCFDLYDSALRNAMLWGSFASRDRATDAMESILGHGLLLCMVPGSPVWHVAAEGAAA